MIVIAVIGVIMAIAIPNFSRYQCVIRGKKLGLNASGVSELCKKYKEDYQGLTKIEALEAIHKNEIRFFDLGIVIEGDVKSPAAKPVNKDVESLKEQIKRLKRQLDDKNTPEPKPNRSWKN